MPNWCDNTVTLRHPNKEVIDALDAEMSKKNEQGRSMAQPFNHLRPNPTGEWDYNWSCENWGCKWDADVIDWERRDDNEIWISMNTAWAPPTTLYDYLVEEGWEVEAVYHEPGMCFGGLYSTEFGDDYYEYDPDDRESLEALPADVECLGGLLDYYDERKANGELDEEEVD